MRCWPVRGGVNRWLALEAVAAGLAYGAGLCWISVCFLASFRPDDLGGAYWSGVLRVRSDTCGILAFIAVGVCFGTSEYLRLGRRRDAAVSPGRGSSRGATELFALATSETVAILATVVVIYVSVNEVTHPATLGMRATHLAAWPTEATLRVVGLFLCVCSITVLRYLFAAPASRRGGRPAKPSSIDGIGRQPAWREPAGDRREAQDVLGQPAGEIASGPSTGLLSTVSPRRDELEQPSLTRPSRSPWEHDAHGWRARRIPGSRRDGQS